MFDELDKHYLAEHAFTLAKTQPCYWQVLIVSLANILMEDCAHAFS